MSLRSESVNGVLRLTLDAPEKRNAIDIAMRDALRDALADVAEGAVLLRGEGDHFCAGIDLSASPAPGIDVVDRMRTSTQDLVRSIRRCRAPVVVAVQGTCAGIALGLVAAADVSIAAFDARFDASFLKRGLVLDGGLAHALVHTVGLVRARSLALGPAWSANEAVVAGLVTASVPGDELLQEATRRAEELAGRPKHAVTLAKDLLNAAADADFETVLLVERAAQGVLTTTPEFAAGSARFLARDDR